MIDAMEVCAFTLTRFTNPGHVVSKGFVEYLNFSEFLKITALFRLFSLLGKLSGKRGVKRIHRHHETCETYPLSTPKTRFITKNEPMMINETK